MFELSVFALSVSIDMLAKPHVLSVRLVVPHLALAPTSFLFIFSAAFPTAWVLLNLWFDGSHHFDKLV